MDKITKSHKPTYKRWDKETRTGDEAGCLALGGLGGLELREEQRLEGAALPQPEVRQHPARRPT